MTPQPGRHHTGIPQQAVPLQCCEQASRPLGLHYTRVDALADCRYCLPDVRGQPGSYRHLWHPQGVSACHSDWGALRWLHTPHPSLADTIQASHNRQCHCSAVSRPRVLHYVRVDALQDCRYCVPEVRGQPGSYRHLWHPEVVPACHSEWGALRWLHTPHPSLADTTQASHNRQCHCSADSRPQGLLACTTLELMHYQTVTTADWRSVGTGN